MKLILTIILLLSSTFGYCYSAEREINLIENWSARDSIRYFFNGEIFIYYEVYAETHDDIC